MPPSPQDLADWLRSVLADQPPTHGIIAFNIGLFEVEDGFCVYVCGSETYDEAGDGVFTATYRIPTDKYLYLPHPEGTTVPWESCLSDVVDATREALNSGLLTGT
jgi:hypothetical protein